jgi:homoserine kinase
VGVKRGVRLKLPATSANLGPGFDAAGLAMSMHLVVEAHVAKVFAIEATGRNADVCGDVSDSLIVETYRGVMERAGREVLPLQMKLLNEIPLGMGCGSSAAALLAGVLLANHFGGLGMSAEDVVAEASGREGHPDNVAACFCGGLTASSMLLNPTSRGWGTRIRLTSATVGRDLPWRLWLALPGEGLATSKARAMLPDSYSRADAVENIQATALLVAAFALRRPELLAAGTRDRIHQPYRSEACPLLPKLLPLAGQAGIYSVTLSGAGPSVLLIADPQVTAEVQLSTVRKAAEGAEVLQTLIDGSGAAALET